MVVLKFALLQSRKNLVFLVGSLPSRARVVDDQQLLLRIERSSFNEFCRQESVFDLVLRHFKQIDGEQIIEAPRDLLLTADAAASTLRDCPVNRRPRASLPNLQQFVVLPDLRLSSLVRRHLQECGIIKLDVRQLKLLFSFHF